MHGRSGGFTLIEVLIVMSIVGTLGALALPPAQRIKEAAMVARAIGDIRTLQAEIIGFQADDQKLPASLGAINRGSMLDPWGNPYRYLNFDLAAGKGKGAPGNARKDRFLVPLNSSFDLYSMGKDGKSSPPLTASASQDDIVRANDGGFVGLASRY